MYLFSYLTFIPIVCENHLRLKLYVIYKLYLNSYLCKNCLNFLPDTLLKERNDRGHDDNYIKSKNNVNCPIRFPKEMNLYTCWQWDASQI